MKQFSFLVRASCFLAAVSGSASAEIPWQEAVTRLDAERSNVVSCAAQLKTYGTDAQQQAGEVAYEKAKEEIDRVLDALLAALAGEGATLDPSELEPHLEASIRERIAFCKTVDPLVPATSGAKHIFRDMNTDIEKAKSTAKEALGSLYHRTAAAASERLTTKSQLEATKWPKFSRVAPGR